MQFINPRRGPAQAAGETLVSLINVLSPTMVADFLLEFNSNRFLKITRSIFSELFKRMQSRSAVGSLKL